MSGGGAGSQKTKEVRGTARHGLPEPGGAEREPRRRWRRRRRQEEPERPQCCGGEAEPDHRVQVRRGPRLEMTVGGRRRRGLWALG